MALTKGNNKMKASKVICALALASSVLTGQALAASWQDQLSSAASELSNSSGTASTAGTASSGLSLSTLTGLLNGGNQALSANSMTNAAGVMEYCAKNKLASATSTENLKSQLMNKLGMEDTAKAVEKPDYNQGLMGLLNTGKGQQLDLTTIGSSPLAEKVKTKACDMVLKQAANFVS